jgi:glyoxylase I family protein
MAKVTGIGGLFIRSNDPVARAKWYKDVLDIDAGSNAIWMQDAGMTVFAPFAKDTDYFAADQQFMLNFRVEGLDELITKCAAMGIEVTTNPEWDDPSFGRFARIKDPEGLAIELWEAPAG